MESITAVEDKLIDGLSFKLGAGASYITDRRSVSFQPQGSNIYQSQSGTRLLRIALNGSGWLDPSTVRISYDLVNGETGGTKNLRMLGGAYSVFERARLLCGGTVIEDIDSFARVSHMLQLLKSKDSRLNEQAEGLGVEWCEHQYLAYSVNSLTGFTGGTPAVSEAARALNADTYEGIKPGDSQRVMFKPCFGMFAESQEKFIPIEYANLILELQLVSNPDDPVLFSGLYDSRTAENTAQGAARAASTFYKSNCTNQWRIQNVEVKCDLITIDDQLNASYSQHLLSGKTLSINYSTMITQVHNITAQSKPSINVTRALTRLKGIFCSLAKNDLVGPFKPGAKEYRTFWSPMSIENGYYFENHNAVSFRHTTEGEFKFYAQLGSKRFPEYPAAGHPECYSMLRKMMGHRSSTIHSFDVTPRNYRDNRMILAVDMEKVSGGEAGWSGINTKSGSQLTITFEYNSGNVGDGIGNDVKIGQIGGTGAGETAISVSRTGARLADRMYVTLVSDNIIEISANGVSIYD
jgi:hypothetical protein